MHFRIYYLKLSQTAHGSIWSVPSIGLLGLLVCWVYIGFTGLFGSALYLNLTTVGSRLLKGFLVTSLGKFFAYSFLALQFRFTYITRVISLTKYINN